MICFDFTKTLSSMNEEKVVNTRELVSKHKNSLMKKGLIRDYINKYIDIDYAASDFEEMIEKANEIKKSGSMFIILADSTLGISLKSIIDSVGNGSTDVLFLGDSLSANSVFKALDTISNRGLYLYVMAQDLSKPEIGANFRVIRQWLENKYGRIECAKRIIVASKPDSIIHKLSIEHGYMFIEYKMDFPIEYIAFNPAAFFPYFVSGVELEEFLLGAKASVKELELEDVSPIIDYVIIRWLAYQEGIEVESVCTFEPSLESFCEWRARLLGNDMIYHGYSLFLRDLDNLKYYHSKYKNKIMETFINIRVPLVDIVVRPDATFNDGLHSLDNISFNELNSIATENIIKKHREEGMMVNEIQCRRLSAINMGSLTFFFMAAGIIVGEIIERYSNKD